MKKNLLISLTLLLSTIFVPISCNKGPIQYTFRGKVIESVYGSGLAGVEINVSQRLFNGSVTTANFSSIATIYSDDQGYYTLVFDREKAVEFKIKLNKDGYFSIEDVINSSEVTTENSNEFSYLMEPVSWVNFDIYNLNPETWDQLTLVLYDFRNGCVECAGQEYYYFYQDLDTNLYFKTTGGVYAHFLYKDEFSGQTKMDSIYCTPFDTAVYSFSY